MSLGRNLQFLRRTKQITQEELAEKLNVSRQTVSKWELDTACPEIDKLIELGELFSCTLDQLIREDMTVMDDIYSSPRTEQVEAFRYLRHIVISVDPETDAIEHMRREAVSLGISRPQIIGWDFPHLSQEQINAYNMHGYAAALILPDDVQPPEGAQIFSQPQQQYAAITIRDPFSAPFTTIPKAYQLLLTWMKATGARGARRKNAISCFEKEYTADGVCCMDVYMIME